MKWAVTLTEAGKQGLNEAAVQLEDLSRVTLFVDGHTDDRGTTVLMGNALPWYGTP
jgi:outer membrane protein OmpA-like peptidoglycan-associated protein